MNTINTHAKAVPAMFQLKGEVQSKRDQAKASGKPMKNSVAMKEIARKYGFRTWEALQSAAAKSGAGLIEKSVTLLVIDGDDQALIVNRKIVMTCEPDVGDSKLYGVSERLAEALCVQINRVNYKADGDVDGPDWTFENIAAKLRLIDQPTGETSSVTAVGSVAKIPGKASSQTFDEVFRIGRPFHEYRHSYEPYIDFDNVVGKGNHPEHGEVDYMLEVSLNVTPGEPITAYYGCRILTENDGFTGELPPEDIRAQAKKMAMELLDRLIAAGVNLELSNIER